ncbi:MAG TPA: hypothetical protein VHF67_02095 [Gaiellaceae bacterium]|nr:hypothetical protein [Gaiellaceae bacterium]
MSLRGRPVEQPVVLPDGREARVRVGVPDDPYIGRQQLDTVSLEVWAGEEAIAAVNTVLAPEHESEARSLAREVAAGLESGALEPTAGALEPLAERFPSTRETS